MKPFVIFEPQKPWYTYGVLMYRKKLYSLRSTIQFVKKLPVVINGQKKDKDIIPGAK